MSELTEAVIEQHLKTLKPPAMRREYRNARQAGADSWTFEDYLRGTARPRGPRPRSQHHRTPAARSALART